MADEIKRISVRIGGMSYQLVSAENENYTRQISAKADEMIRRVMQNNPQLSLNMSTILALVNALDELAKAFAHLNALDSHRQESEKQSGEIRKELARLREQNWEMKKELLRINSLCHDYETLLAKRTAEDLESDPSTRKAPPESNPSFPEDSLAESPAPIAAGSGESGVTAAAEGGCLKQANLEDYLRENGWPQPFDS